MLDLQDHALLSRAVRDLDNLRRDLLRIAEMIGHVKAVLSHHGGSSPPQVSKPLAGAVLIPPPRMEGPQTHGRAEVSEHDLDILCEADLHTVSSWQPVAAAMEDVGCTGAMSPLPALHPPVASDNKPPPRIINRRATGSVVDLAGYRLA